MLSFNRDSGARPRKKRLDFDFKLVYSPPPSSTVTPWELGFEWLTGVGPRHRNFTDGDNFAEEMRKHNHIQQRIETMKQKLASQCYQSCDNADSFIIKSDGAYSLSGVQGVGKYIKDYSTLFSGGHYGNLAVTFSGSYTADFEATAISCCTGKAKLKITTLNRSHAASALRPPVIGYYDCWQEHVAPRINKFFESGPGSPTKQTVVLDENLTFRPTRVCLQ